MLADSETSKSRRRVHKNKGFSRGDAFAGWVAFTDLKNSFLRRGIKSYKKKNFTSPLLIMLRQYLWKRGSNNSY